MQTSSIDSQLKNIDGYIWDAIGDVNNNNNKGAEGYMQKAVQEIDQLREQKLPANVRKYLDEALNDLNKNYSNSEQLEINLSNANDAVLKAEEAE